MTGGGDKGGDIQDPPISVKYVILCNSGGAFKGGQGGVDRAVDQRAEGDDEKNR